MTAAVVVVLTSQSATLRTFGSFLVVDQPLEHAAAIVVLAGQMPQRETEAAAIYRQGWASRVVIVPGADARATSAAPTPPGWKVRRALLVGLGVPAEAISVADGSASDTVEELELAQRALPPDAERVILVSSKYHTRRVLTAWELTAPGQLRAILRVAQRDPFDPDDWWHHDQMRASVTHEYLGMLALGWHWVWPTLLPATHA